MSYKFLNWRFNDSVRTTRVPARRVFERNLSWLSASSIQSTNLRSWKQLYLWMNFHGNTARTVLWSRRISELVLGSLSTRVFEKRTATGREHLACQGRVVSQIFILIISNGKKIVSNVNVVVRRQVKRENSSLPVAVRVSKTRVLKLPSLLY